MILATCTHESRHKHGKDRKGNQRFKCALCSQTFVEQSAKPLGELRISMKEASLVLGMLMECVSIRGVERLRPCGLTAASVVFAFENGVFGFDAVLDRRSEELIHFDHGTADEAGDAAAARFSLAGFMAEVVDGAHHEHDRHDDEHRDGRNQKEDDLQGHDESVEHGRRHASIMD
jgi:hypothetical protein